MSILRFAIAVLRSPRRAYALFLAHCCESHFRPLRVLGRRLRFGAANARNSAAAAELSWLEFEQRILASAGRYRGIFVQEAVVPWTIALHQRPQHIAVTLGKLGYLVIYRSVDDGVIGAREVEQNVWVTPRLEVDSLTGCVHSFYSTSSAFSLRDIESARKRAKATIYEYIDAIDPSISGGPDRIARLTAGFEAAKQGRFSYVACSSRALYEDMEAALPRDRLLYIPNGVDVEHYTTFDHRAVELPRAYSEFCARFDVIAGYFGAIAPWLWFEMLGELVDARQDLGFVFIGPDYHEGLRMLPRRDNVMWLDAVDYRKLPAYAARFTVATVPFEPGDISRKTSPLKLFEYFALRKPVVCTADMRECTAFDTVFPAADAGAFSRAIDAAAALARSIDHQSRLLDLARANDWRSRVRDIEQLFTAR